MFYDLNAIGDMTDIQTLTSARSYASGVQEYEYREIFDHTQYLRMLHMEKSIYCWQPHVNLVVPSANEAQHIGIIRNRATRPVTRPLLERSLAPADFEGIKHT